MSYHTRSETAIYQASKKTEDCALSHSRGDYGFLSNEKLSRVTHEGHRISIAYIQSRP